MASNDLSKNAQSIPQRATGDVFSVMRDEMDRIFERLETGFPRLPHLFTPGGGREWMVPELDVRDTGKQISIDVELPGVDEKDVTVTLANGVVTIKGEKKTEHEEGNGRSYMAERSYGAFERSLRLPETIDDAKLEAKFDKGVLRIVAQKRPEAVKAEKRIEIKKA